MIIKGCLEVKAKTDSKMGVGDRVVPAGSIGYVTSTKDGKWTVYWPNIKSEYKGDWKTGVHLKTDLEPTGRRG